MARLDLVKIADLSRQVETLRAELDQCRDLNREIDHRAANSLQLAASFLRLQRARVRDPEAGAVLDVAVGRIDAIAHAHRHFNLRATGHAVDLRDILGDLASDLAVSLGVTTELALDPVTVPARTAAQIVVMVNELVVNACKHAFADGAPGRVSILAGPTGDGRLVLSVADGGRGLPDGFDMGKTKGLGMQVVRATARALGGEVRAMNDGGARFVVTIPLPAAVPADRAGGTMRDAAAQPFDGAIP